MELVFPLVGVVLIFWLLIIRPQARRRRELAGLLGSLEVGDEVMLTSGVYGTVQHVDDDTVMLEIADGVTIKVAAGAVGQNLTQHHAAQPAPDEVVGSEEK